MCNLYYLSSRGPRPCPQGLVKDTFQVLALVLEGQVIVLGGQVLVLVLGGQVLVPVLGGQDLVNIPAILWKSFRCSIILCDVLLVIEKNFLKNISSHPLCPSGNWFADRVQNSD